MHIISTWEEKMRTWVLWLLLLISMTVADVLDATNIDPGVLDPCMRPGAKDPGCPTKNHPPGGEANPYSRGCTGITRCRKGPPHG